LLCAFVALGVAVRSGSVAGDITLRAVVPHLALLELLSTVAAVIPWTAAVLVVGGLLWLIGRRRLAVTLVLGDVSVELAVLVAKLVVDRVRPVAGLPADLITSASFPSGHVARVAVAVGILILFAGWPRGSARAAAVAVGVAGVALLAVARIASGEHWPSDVLGSLLLAGAILGLADRSWRRFPDPRPADH